MAVTISELAGQAGVSPDTLRYYERRGLLRPPARSTSGYRLYDEAVIERLRFIKNAQRIGLRLDDVKELLEISDRGACPCGHTATVLERRLKDLDEELRHLRVMRRDLSAFRERNAACTRSEAGWWCDSFLEKKRR